MTVGVIADLCADILVSGNVTPIYGQVEQYVDDYTLEIGGSAALFATQYVRLGGQLNLYGILGNDTLGHMVKSRLEEENIDTDFLTFSEQEKTTIGLGLSRNGDRAMLTYKGTLTAINAEWIAKTNLLDSIDHLHIASFYLLESLKDHWVPLLEKCKQSNISVSLDTNWAPDENWSSVHEILPWIDIFIPNEQEALLISGKQDLNEAGHWLAKLAKEVVIKCGPDGASYFHQNHSQQFKIPKSFLVDFKIADTTGAGDNFDAGFLTQWLRKRPIETCIQTGMYCGTRSLTKIGGISGQSTPVELNQMGIEI